LRRDLGGGRVDFMLGAGADHQIHAVRRQRLGNAAPQPLRGRADDCLFALDAQIHAVLPKFFTGSRPSFLRIKSRRKFPQKFRGPGWRCSI
jgi:hypothetical protein